MGGSGGGDGWCQIKTDASQRRYYSTLLFMMKKYYLFWRSHS